MKSFCLSLFTLCIFFSAKCQLPVFTYQEHGPQVGDSICYKRITGNGIPAFISEDSSAVWDASTAQTDSFPFWDYFNANSDTTCSNMNLSGYFSDSSVLYRVSSCNDSFFDYSEASAIMLAYPLYYSNLILHSEPIYCYNGADSTYFQGSNYESWVKYIAHGTLYMPNGISFNNTIVINYGSRGYSCAGNYNVLSNRSHLYVPGFRYPVLKTYIIQSQSWPDSPITTGGEFIQTDFLTQIQNLSPQENFSCSCHYNSFTAFAEINFNTSEQSDFVVLIFSGTGEIVAQQNCRSNSVHINMAGRAAGLYIVKVFDKKRSSVCRFAKD